MKPAIVKPIPPRFLLPSAVLLAVLCCPSLAAPSKPPAAEPASPPGDLAVFNRGFPRTLFFRNAEGNAVLGTPAAEFDALVNDFEGIVVKAFDEEKYGLSRYALDYFRAFKERNPRQLVLLHFNGGCRDPRPGSATPDFFAGHWLHYNGCRLTADLAAGAVETSVENPALFRMDAGKQHLMPDDVTICALQPDGTPDWKVFEYAKIVSIDTEGKRLVLQRGMFGTTARDWKAGEAYIAAVVAGGSFPMEGDSPQLLWSYNFSPDAPRDARGRRLIDVLAGDVADKLNPGGPGDYFDGVTFDVMPWQPAQRFPKHVARAGRGQDTDGDGRSDFGVRDGVNRYGAGVEEFLHKLRERLGPERLILRDAGRRACAALNGVESEGWPSPFDPEINEWSSGMNDHAFWHARGASPRLVYLHYKYADRREGAPNKPLRLPYPQARLVLAAAQLLGDALTTNNGPAPEPGQPYGLFDELKMGVDNRRNWLGLPLEPPRILTSSSPDLLLGAGTRIDAAFQKKVSSKDARIDAPEAEGIPALRAAAIDPQAESFSITLEDVPLSGPDLVISLRLRAAPMRGASPDVARRVTVKRSGPPAESSPRELWTWADGEWFDARFYFRGLTGSSESFTMVFEDSGAVELADIKVHAHPDAQARAFEHGLVLANPSLQPFAFDLGQLYPGRKFRRLQGHPGQDPETNNGQTAGPVVTLPPRDALFLMTDDKANTSR